MIRGKIQGGRIILGDNPAGRCFVLKGLILINFFNCFKIPHAKFLVKFLKGIEDTFCPIYNLRLKEGQMRHEGNGEDLIFCWC